MLARVIFGARTSLTIAVVAVVAGLVVGGLLGLVAGYYRGTVGAVLTTLFNVLLSIPALVLALSLVAVFASADEDVSNGRKMSVIIAAGHRDRSHPQAHHPGPARCPGPSASSSRPPRCWAPATAGSCSGRCCPTWRRP